MSDATDKRNFTHLENSDLPCADGVWQPSSSNYTIATALPAEIQATRFPGWCDVERLGSTSREMIAQANRSDPDVEQRNASLIAATLDLLIQLQALIQQIRALYCMVLPLNAEAAMSKERGYHSSYSDQGEPATTERDDVTPLTEMRKPVEYADYEYREGAD